MATDARAELHGLIDQLPDEAVSKIKDVVVAELRLRDAVIASAEGRGLSVEETRVAGGTVFKLNRPDESDPVLRAFLEAPEDDEPLTDEDRAAIAEGKADVERGDVVAWDEYDPDRRARA